MTSLSGRRVLVTGAGGSIGSEICRQVSRQDPALLVMLDRDESALHALQLSIEGSAMLEDEGLVLADIRDVGRMVEVFETYRPDIVIHAAALKHVTFLERFPSEAVKTNIMATAELLAIADRVGVEKFINISTDKAADPISVLGYTKRITERLASHYGRSSVRFGNVYGSRGSVVETFRAQVEAGGPVTVTNPNVTRWMMSVEQAVFLVLESLNLANGGEVYVLDMGEPVRIVDLARRIIGKRDDISIVFTGLRPGEKLVERLFGSNETPKAVHPRISSVDVPPLDPARSFVPVWGENERIVDALKALT